MTGPAINPYRSDNRRPRIALPSIEKANAFINRHPSSTPESRGTEAVRVLLRDLKEGREVVRQATESGDAAGTLNERIRELEGENDELASRIPGAEQVVISKADATELEAYRKLGKPDEVAARVKEAGELGGRVAESDRATNAETAAKALGYNVDSMKTIAKDLGLVFEFKDETIDGKTVKVPYVKRSTDAKDVAATKLSEFTKANPVYLVALQAKSADGSGGGGTGNDFISTTEAPAATSGEQSQQSGTVFPVSTQSSQSAAPSGTVDKFIKNRDEANAKRRNPLSPAPAATK